MRRHRPPRAGHNFSHATPLADNQHVLFSFVKEREQPCLDGEARRRWDSVQYKRLTPCGAVVERDLGSLPQRNLSIVRARAAGLDTVAQELLLQGGARLPFDRLCLCLGATPRVRPQLFIYSVSVA
jgi:hypothetical protein